MSKIDDTSNWLLKEYFYEGHLTLFKQTFLLQINFPVVGAR